MVGGPSLPQFVLFGVVFFAAAGGTSEAYWSTLIAAFLDGCDSRLTEMHRGGRVCLTARGSGTMAKEAPALPLAQLLAGKAADNLAETAVALSRCLFVGPVAEITVPAGSRQCDESCLEHRRWLQHKQLRHRLWSNIGDTAAENPVIVATRAHSGLHLLWLSEANTSPTTVDCSLTCRGVAICSNRSADVVEHQSANEFGKQQKPSWLWRTLASRLTPVEVPRERLPIVCALAISVCSSGGSPESGPRTEKAAAAVGGTSDSANPTGDGENIGSTAFSPTINRFAVYARRLRRDKLSDDVIIDHGMTNVTDLGLAATATKGDETATVVSSPRDSGDATTADFIFKSSTAGDEHNMPTLHSSPAMAEAHDSLQPKSEHPLPATTALISANGTEIGGFNSISPETIAASGKVHFQQVVTAGGWPQADASDERVITSSRFPHMATVPSPTRGLSGEQSLVEMTTNSGPVTLATIGTDMHITLRDGVATPTTITPTSYVTSSLGDVAAPSAGVNETSVGRNTDPATDSSGSDTRPPFFDSSSSATLLWPVGENLTSTTVANGNVSDSRGSTVADDGRSLAPPRTSEQTSASTLMSTTNSRDTSDSSHATTPTADSGKWQVTGSEESRSGGGSDVEAIAAGVTVAAAILIGSGAGVYIWYRKKYPVRMPIGRKFVTHSNPEYKVPPVPMVTLVKDEV